MAKPPPLPKRERPSNRRKLTQGGTPHPAAIELANSLLVANMAFAAAYQAEQQEAGGADASTLARLKREFVPPTPPGLAPLPRRPKTAAEAARDEAELLALRGGLLAWLARVWATLTGR